MSISASVDKLIDYAKANLGLAPENEICARNAVLDILGSPDYAYTGEKSRASSPDEVLKELLAECASQGIEGADGEEQLADKIMGALTLSPHDIRRSFSQKLAQSSKAATDWFYDYCVKNDYVKKSKLDKNPRFEENGLIITINKAKPEFRDPKKAASGNSVKGGYPKCAICRENEGYERPGFSRRNLRTNSLRLAGEDWFWQYSPYAYFAEHGIAICCAHTPMKLDEKTAVRLFDFVEQFPHYFIGNNAPLPRVGGSILMHDHFQGGLERLPMQKAGVRVRLRSPRAGVSVGIVDWHNSAVRFEGKNRAAIEELAYSLVTAWRAYKNEDLDILPCTGDVPHNTASLIARKAEGGYILDMILRNNRTSERYPDGIFHAHREYHHIKSESIGLIEAMGLFVLPARLKRQLGEVRAYLTGERAYREEDLAEDMRIFAPMIARLLAAHGKVPAAQADAILKAEVEDICRAILENTAVFKRVGAGERAFTEFFASAGFPAVKED